MNLKEAFRFQNALQGLIEESASILESRQNILKCTTTHLRSKVDSQMEDLTTDDFTATEYTGKANLVVAFLMMLMDEKEKLSEAIAQAKRSLPMDMDSAVGLNQQRQRVARLFQTMNGYRSSEKIVVDGGTGYRFNSEGNQVMFRCDAKKVTTIDFDRNKVRGLSSALSKKADAVSAELDKLMVNTEVAYQAPFDVNDSFSDIFKDFEGAQSKGEATA